MAESMPLATRFSEWVVPQISNGCFGPFSKIVKYGIDPARKGEDQFASTVQFFEIEVLQEDVLRTINVVVKFQPENEMIRKVMNAKGHFYNEVLMYSEILPLIDRDGIVKELFCDYYHGSADLNMSDDSDYVVLQDLSKAGYKLSNEKLLEYAV